MRELMEYMRMLLLMHDMKLYVFKLTIRSHSKNMKTYKVLYRNGDLHNIQECVECNFKQNHMYVIHHYLPDDSK